MKTLNPTGIKILKIIHLLFASVWIGGALSLILLLLTTSPQDSEAMYVRSLSVKLIDDVLVIPGAMGCLLTGFVYSIWTKWGFFRHNWITVKWIMTVAMILFGTFVMGPLVNGNVYAIDQIELYTTDNREFYGNVAKNIATGGIQVACMIFIFVISVVKPWKKRAKSA